MSIMKGEYDFTKAKRGAVVVTTKAMIERRPTESVDDISKGRVHGPFRSLPELLRSLHKTKKSKTR